MSEQELEEYQQQLQAVEEGLRDDPENESLLELRTELEELVGLLKQSLSNTGEDTGISSNKEQNETQITDISQEISEKEWENKSASQSGQTTPSAQPSAPSSASESVVSGSPSRTTSTPTPPPPLPSSQRGSQTSRFNQNLSVGSIVLAKYVSGDRKFYRAKITAITGSKENPIFTVKFLQPQHANVIETVRSDGIREINQEMGRGSSAPNHGSRPAPPGTATSRPKPPPPPSTTLTHPTSYPQNSYKHARDAAAALEEQNKATKVAKQASQQNVSKAKLLDNQKNKWQQFSKKMNKTGKSKKLGDSMFRTSDDPNARVGVVKGISIPKPSKPAKHVFDPSSRIN
ncbi:hypothetical protein AWJ20_997 [Sugiyamaella lignohabitans]|uniref:Tudor domain-containing protein n=1 Tax=Sugiyamaella lignohabitans TaxID=796027 RepID=A0A167DBR7_9ASCO|nr:uncharacterized protein AWJ20_997 [Sugiyamaella lignohabitans]ANB12729.1 hypothetical protein AWJ20_997 [Sugiyamaella lignohabitans]